MKKILLSFFITLFSFSLLADEKPGRFFKDQPDVTDDYQIHFIYLLAKDSKDREWDINGKMEEIVLEMNERMAKATAEQKKSNGISKKYKLDYRKDGKLDITFVRVPKNKKDFHKYYNNNIVPYLWLNDFKNPKKIYYNFAELGGVDGGEAGVHYGSTYLLNKHNKSQKKKIITITLHELHHTQGGGFNCVPGMGKTSHYSNREVPYQLGHGEKLGPSYIHGIPDCPELVDSVYLTPTSKEPYDPYKLMCSRELGKYTHPKIVKVYEQNTKIVAKGKWPKRGFGSYCKVFERHKPWTEEIAKRRYEEKRAH